MQGGGLSCGMGCGLGCGLTCEMVAGLVAGLRPRLWALLRAKPHAPLKAFGKLDSSTEYASKYIKLAPTPSSPQQFLFSFYVNIVYIRFICMCKYLMGDGLWSGLWAGLKAGLWARGQALLWAGLRAGLGLACGQGSGQGSGPGCGLGCGQGIGQWAWL